MQANLQDKSEMIPDNNDTEDSIEKAKDNAVANTSEINPLGVETVTQRIRSFAHKYYPKCRSFCIKTISSCKDKLQNFTSKHNAKQKTDVNVISSPDNSENEISYIVNEIPYNANGVDSLPYHATNYSQNVQYGVLNNQQNAQYGAPNNPQNAQYGVPNNPQSAQYGVPNNPQNAQYGVPNNQQNAQYGVPNYPQNAQYGVPNYPQNAQYGGVPNYSQYGSYPAQRHDIPKCTCCGYVGPWVIDPLIRPMDWVIGIALTLFACGSGLIYLGIVAAIRSNKDNRNKSCANCKAKNLFTFIY